MSAAGFASQSALARAAGVPQPTINRILRGSGSQGPETQTVVKLAQACGVNFAWLNEGTGPMLRGQEQPAAPVAGAMRVVVPDDDDPDYVPIEMVRLRLSCGVTGFQTEPEVRDGGTMMMPRRWLERNNFDSGDLIAIRVKGESMEPALYEDDVVVIHTADKRLVDGAVYAFNYEGEAVIKRLSRDAGQWWLSSDNADQRKYHRKELRGVQCEVIGRVVRKESDRI